MYKKCFLSGLLALTLLNHPCFGSCTVAVGAIGFGNFNPFQPAPININSQLSIQCNALSPIVNYSIALSTGLGGGFNPRQMLSGLNTLNYNLYTAANLVTIWGDGTGGTGVISANLATCLLAPCLYTVYGQLPAPQPTAHVGAYSDTITATVTY